MNKLAVIAIVLLSSIAGYGSAPYRVNKSYEDTVRVAILWNDPTGQCSDSTAPVGQKTRDFVVQALDTTKVKNVKILLNSRSQNVSWSQIQALWGPNRLPHVIVHVNAGWSTSWGAPDWNGPVLNATLDSAVANKIGVVSVGDDAASLANNTFGFYNVDNVPAPLGDGTSIQQLWIGLNRANDERTKVFDYNGKLTYPGVNGIISNAVDSILKGTQLNFYPFGAGRCQADADRYAAANSGKLTMLGYQQGIINGVAQPPHPDNDLNVIVAIQDTLPNYTIRRGVALSFQPQFLQNSTASQQVVYDAIMFASLAHTLSVPTSITLKTKSDTITAGNIDTLIAYVIDQKNDTIYDPAISVKLSWTIINPHAGDQFVGVNYGQKVLFTAKEAYRTVKVYVVYTADSKVKPDTASIYIKPGPANHLVIEGSPSAPLYGDFPVGGNGQMTIGSSQTTANAYAVLRDANTNFVRLSTSTRWDTLSPGGIITASVRDATKGEGIFTKINRPGQQLVRAVDIPTGFSDTVNITVSNITYDSLRIMQYDISQGKLVQIFSLTKRIFDSTTLFVQGLRTDRVGPPGSGGWVDVPGMWNISSQLSTNPKPPSSASNAWPFTPIDTGHGAIGVSLSVSGGLPSTSIPVIFTTGLPLKLVLYPIKGAPGTTLPHPEPPFVADTMTADETYSLLYAKLFDQKGYWLSEYETNYTLSQQITWSVSPVTETQLSAVSGYSNTLRSTQAYRLVKVIARWNSLSDSVLIWVDHGVANHLVIEASATINNYKDDDPLSKLTIRSDQLLNYAYAILRDSSGNFAGYSTHTKWLSLDTSVFKADTGIKTVGEGVAKRAADKGLSQMVAIDTLKNMRDTVPVEVQNIYYKKLRIYVLDPVPLYIDTIQVRTDEKKTLYVEGQRSDNDNWERVPVQWTLIGNLRTTTKPPENPADHWDVIPDTVGTGWIKVTMGNAIPDSVYAVFIPGLPGSMALYQQKGDPTGFRSYPVPPLVDTVIAGTPTQIVSKIFDRNGIWLSGYESSSVANMFSWTISKVGPGAPDTLLRNNSYLNSFTPTNAYNTYTIQAQFNDGSRQLSAKVSFYIIPGLPHHLVIESSPNITGEGLVSDQPVDLIQFDARDSTKTAFAVIRDSLGNFINLSQSTQWLSIDTSIVTAKEGVSQFGEGKITRVGSLGETQVVAINRQNVKLKDTVRVLLSKFSYDSLRIVVKDSVRIEALEMRSDEDTVLQVQGKRSFDGRWVSIDADWSYITRKATTGIQSSSIWNFAPGDTGIGIIVVTRGSSVPDTITTKVNPGLPVKIAIYPKEGTVPDPSNLPYPDPRDTITVIAGKSLPLVAKIFDHNNVHLYNYELQTTLSDQINWKVEESPGFDSSGQLSKLKGHANSFMPVRAYQSVYIIASFPFKQQVFSDTILLKIIPGAAKQLVLEGSPDWRSSPNKINPIPVVQITDSMTSRSVYAILRDSIGNYVGYANVKTWGVVNNDTSIAVRAGNTSFGEGVIERRLRDGSAKVYALDQSGLKDTVDVILLPYYFTKLRILVGDSIVQHLTITTNDYATLKVQGLRSDTALWVDVSTKWENASKLKMLPVAPGNAHQWTFSPTDTGNGWIRVTMGSDSITHPDTLNVTFLPGPPTKVKINILTLPEDRIAGQPIKISVEIYNDDGLVPGKFCFYKDSGKGATYTDYLGIKNGYKPFVILDGDTVFLSDTGSECFQGGVDTAILTLFNAPSNPDSLHKISLQLGNLKTESKPFSLLPGALDAISIENPDGTPAKDTIIIKSPDGSFTVVSVGYDRYGNKIGPVAGNWSTDSTLHKIPKSDNVSRIYYDAINASDNESGNLSVVAVSSTKKPSDKVFVKVVGPLTTLTQAFTRDLNGNGYLDHIELHFSKPVSFPTDSFTIPGLRIHYGSTTFKLDSIVGAGRKDSVWIIAIKEDNSQKKPQTDWEPFISFSEMSEIGIGSISEKKITDGAGPVIWEVTKQVKGSGTDRTNDVVTVTFSEPIQRASDGSDLTGSDKPSAIFYVWERDTGSSNKFKLVDSILIGIDAITPNKSSLSFVTTNNVDINSRFYFSLKSDSSAFITDKVGKGNPPVPQNQMVKVKVIGSTPELYIYPNPTTPSFVKVPAGKLYAENVPQARDWAKIYGGAAFGFSITVPDEPGVSVKCYIKIYDAAGNMVASTYTPNLLSSIPEKAADSASLYNVVMYWNGSNDNSMKVAPGIYMTVVYLNYCDAPDPQKYKDCRMVGLVGIRN